MLMTNIDIQDRLINGPFRTVVHCKSRNGYVEIIYVKFNGNNAGSKAHRKVHSAITSQSVPIERAEAKFSLNKTNNNSSPLTHRPQFHLILSYACTVHKVNIRLNT